MGYAALQVLYPGQRLNDHIILKVGKALQAALDLAPAVECTCAAKDMHFGRCCKAAPTSDALEAARYRWIREAWLEGADTGEDSVALRAIEAVYTQAEMDAAIDAAIVAEKA
jgi:hypothetical protein